MNVAPRPQLAGLSLFAGVGMLDEGVRAGFDLLGVDYRCVGYVERDAYAASALVARMESAALDQAPIWDDITTFDGGRWRGVVDCIVAGFPCQDISASGNRAGLDGKRSGLFYEVLRVAADCGARFIFLENVAGIVSADATVVDQTEGDLTERAVARVVGELADRGWDAEWLHLHASDVGAAHKRERWFCLAWRTDVGDAGSLDEQTRRPVGVLRGRSKGRPRPDDSDIALADAGCQCDQRRGIGGVVSGAQTASQTEKEQRQWDGNAAHDSKPDVADAAWIPVWQWTGRKRDSGEIFAPGPGDIRGWNRVIADGEFDYRAPAIKPGVCRMVNGLAYRVDQHRADRLRCGGNGVVAAQAAVALVLLVRRMNL